MAPKRRAIKATPGLSRWINKGMALTQTKQEAEHSLKEVKARVLEVAEAELVASDEPSLDLVTTTVSCTATASRKVTIVPDAVPELKEVLGDESERLLRIEGRIPPAGMRWLHEHFGGDIPEQLQLMIECTPTAELKTMALRPADNQQAAAQPLARLVNVDTTYRLGYKERR